MNNDLNSKILIDSIYTDIKKKMKNMDKKKSLAIIIVGEKKDSMTYIKLKIKKCEELGIQTYLYSFSDRISINHIIKSIEALNNYKFISGILVQLPLPKNFTKQDEYKILNSISPNKDIDGFHHLNMGKLMVNEQSILPCTAEGCFRLLKHHNINIIGKHIVIIGSSKVVGLPLSLLLLHNGATTTLCNIYTENIKDIAKSADILISCCGSPHLIDSTWIKKDSIIIDVGINHKDNKIIGDVNYNDVLSKVKYITPVPGCIGPLTIAILIEHLINTM